MIRGMREPPEGVLVGESVPVENDRDEINEGLINELIGVMKGHPVHSRLSEDEMREKAVEYLNERGEI